MRGKASLGDVTKKADETTVVSVQAQLAAAEARLRQKADAASTPRFADLPVTPNLLQDTKHFHGICHGRVGVETPWQMLGVRRGVLKTTEALPLMLRPAPSGRWVPSVPVEVVYCWTILRVPI